VVKIHEKWHLIAQIGRHRRDVRRGLGMAKPWQSWDDFLGETVRESCGKYLMDGGNHGNMKVLGKMMEV